MFVDANGKEFDSIRGRKATVVSDDLCYFEEGQVIVVLENCSVPYCVLVENYKEGCFNPFYYQSDEVNPLILDNELIIEGDEE